MAAQKDFEDGVRKAALQDLVQMATYIGKESRNSACLKERLVPTLVGILDETDHSEEQEWLEELEENLEQKHDLASSA